MILANDLVILYYHRIGKPSAAHRYRGMFTSPQHLRWQVSFLLHKGYQVLTLAEALQQGTRPQGSPPLACITFDDGYRDNFSAGLPILHELGVAATVFIISDDVGKKNLIWSEAGEKHPADLASWDELGLLQQAGWEIASHSHRHVHFSRYSAVQQEDLLAQCSELIQHYLGVRPQTFAYPYGDYSELSRQLVRRHGFLGAVSTRTGLNYRHEQTLFELNRIPCKGFQHYHYLKWLLQTRNLLGSPPYSKIR